MSKFENIDNKLEVLAKQLNAALSVDRPNYLEPLRTFEERRIDWIENGVNKAIIIQPSFEAFGIDDSKWSFINVAWINKNGVAQKPGWRRMLVDKDKFTIIEENIDKLILDSKRNLVSVSLSDIKNIL